MENVLCTDSINKKFYELTADEKMTIDGGGIGSFFAAIGTGIVKGGTVVGGLVGGGAVAGGALIILGTAALAVGIYVGLNS